MTAAPHVSAPIHAPNAALLIDFDNVTMGIRSDLGKELRSLLSSEIIKGKVAVQRAYADWRRYPQYIVPLSEASIDLIFAPAYGSSKKNATDIRLAIDALELVFTRPEIGTFILLSGDSDFSSLVIKLKEYGKYVIGVGIRESSSDLLVQNCDEYYSYNALAGLVKQSDDEPDHKYDPWELVTEAVQRMKRNNDVMRSDRLKQVMQEIDNAFDEKNLGISKFSRFCQEAAQRGLLSVTKLDNGQLEIDLPATVQPTETRTLRSESVAVTDNGEAATPALAPGEERAPRRSRRGRGGRGRDRGEEREPREARPPQPAAASSERVGTDGEPAAPRAETSAPRAETPVSRMETPAPRTESTATPSAPQARPPATRIEAPSKFVNESRHVGAEAAIGLTGERLSRSEAFDLVRRAVNALATGEDSVRASDVRQRARQLLGRDSESLSDRMFVRILKDAHDNGIIDLRRRGDDFEVARASEGATVSDQLARSEEVAVAASTPPAAAPSPRVGMGHRGAPPRGRSGGRPGGRPGAPPPELLSIGVVETVPVVTQSTSVEPSPSENGVPPAAAARAGRGTRGRSKVAKTVAAEAPEALVTTPAGVAPSSGGESKPAAKEKPGRAAKRPAARPRAKKRAAGPKEQ